MQGEELLIKRCINRERKAQKLMYEKYSSLLLGVCMRYTKDIFEAEDILQEGFIKVFTRIKQYEGKGSFIGWLRKIMVNTAITYYHKNIRYKNQQDLSEIEEIIGVEDAFLQFDFTHEELLNTIQDLPSGYKMVFNLYAIEGYKHKEIAEMLGIDENTSKSQYSRARKLIQKKLEELSKTKTS